MSHFPKSLIGLLEPDGRTFRARLPQRRLPDLPGARAGCRPAQVLRRRSRLLGAGHPAPQLGLHRSRRGDVDAQDSAPGSREAQPFAGVGYYLTGFDTAPSIGTLDEKVDGMITWLYVLTGNQVRVFHADERWQPFGDFSVR